MSKVYSIIFGRNDDQIKVLGVRIEPMEVESAILEHPGVAHAAATWFEVPSGWRSIVALVVCKPGTSLTGEELYQYLVHKLPAQMVPSKFIFDGELPLTPQWKSGQNRDSKASDGAGQDSKSTFSSSKQ